MALTKKENFKTYKGILESDTDNDDLIDLFIGWASDFIESQCKRKFEGATYTERYDGDKWRSPHSSRRDVLVLDQYPVSTFTSLHDDTDWVFGSSALIDPSDYDVDEATGIVTLITKRFALGAGNIQAIYIAGYTLPDASGSGDNLPSDIEFACIKLVDLLYMDRGQRTGVLSMNMPDGSNVTFTKGLPIEVKSVIKTYGKRNV